MDNRPYNTDDAINGGGAAKTVQVEITEVDESRECVETVESKTSEGSKENLKSTSSAGSAQRRFEKERKLLHLRRRQMRRPLSGHNSHFSFGISDECLIGLIEKPVVDVFIPEQPGMCMHSQCIREVLKSRLSCYAHLEAQYENSGRLWLEDPNVEYNVRFIPMQEDLNDPFPTIEDDEDIDGSRDKDDDNHNNSIEELNPPSPSPPKEYICKTKHFIRDATSRITPSRSKTVVDEGLPDWYYFERPPWAPPLTTEMIALNERALERNPDEVIVEAGPSKIKVMQKDLACYTNNGLLTDPVIDFYMKLIRQRSLGQECYQKVYVYDCVFYPLLSSRGGLKKVGGTTGAENIFQCEMAFFPVCVREHWRLAVAFFREHRLVLYNSLKGDKRIDSDILCNIENYLKNEYKYRHDRGVASRESVQPPEWTLILSEEMDPIPQQKNNCDCGVFILQFAEYLSRGQEFDFNQDHMSYFRQRMIYETITSQLLIY